MTWLLTVVLRFYQSTISPLLGPSCRYHPTCSSYALVAVQEHGALRGTWLAMRRLGRCHPWAAGGVDLAPARADYRWWGLCPGHDPDELADARTAVTDTPAAEGA